MSKYYTPELEEFHVDFEYEYYYDKGDTWLKSTFQFISALEIEDIYDNIFKKNNLFKKENNGTLLRVKFLDKADIEELGWSQGKLPYQYFLDPYWMLVDLKNNMWSIENLTDDHLVFRGVIKNKSELKRIMNQTVNYYYE